VLKAWRGMRTKQGKWRVEGGELWKERVRSFLTQARNASRPSTADVLKAKRLANWHSALALDQGLQASLGSGLVQYMPGRRLQQLEVGCSRRFVRVDALPEIIRQTSFDRTQRCLIVDKDGKSSLEGLWSGHRGVLHCSLDMGSIGFPARGWMFYGIGVRGERWADAAHRRHNNFEDAINEAGLGVFRAEAVCFTNTGSGPWGENANYNKWQSATTEYLDSTSVDDDLFQALYPFLSHDLHHGRLPQAYGSKPHMEWVREEIRRVVHLGKGAIVRMNRWFQVWHRIRPALPYWSAWLFACLVELLQSGIYAHMSDCSLFKHSDKGAGLSAGAIASSDKAIAGPSHRSVKQKGELDSLRGKCKNGVHLMAEVLGNRSSRAIMAGISKMVKPIEIRHNLDIRHIKTKEGRASFNIGLACSDGLDYVVEGLSWMKDEELMFDMGVMSAGSDWSPGLDEDTATRVLKALLDLWCAWASYEMRFIMLYSSSMPGLAWTQLSEDVVKQKEGMAKMKLLWERLQKFEELSQQVGHSHLSGFLRDLQWTRGQWSREILLSAAECEFKHLPSDVLEQVREASVLVGMSEIVEQAFNDCRAETEGVRNGRQSPLAVWHTIQSSTLLKDYDLDPVQISSADHVSGAHDVPSSMFLADKHEEHFSLKKHKGQEKFFHDMDYPMLSAARYLNIGMGTRLLMHARSENVVKHAWCSLLAIPGTVLAHSFVEEFCGWVLGVNDHGAQVWPGRFLGCGGFRYFELDTSGLKWDQYVVWDYKEWQVFDIKPKLHTQVQREYKVSTTSMSGIFSLELIAEEGGHDLLKHSARRGFPHLTLADLCKLWDDLGCTGKRGQLLLEVLRSVVEHELGPRSEEQWQAIVATRASILGKANWKSVLDENVALAKEVAGKDCDQLEDNITKTKKPAVVASPKDRGGAGGSSAGSAAGGGGENLPKPGPKKVGAFEIRHYRQDEAVLLLPRIKGCTISPVNHRQWQVKYLQRPRPPKSHTCTYDDKEGEAAMHCWALATCVKWAWDVHNECGHDEKCPTDLSILAKT
jgi:hypothetical protein